MYIFKVYRRGHMQVCLVTAIVYIKEAAMFDKLIIGELRQCKQNFFSIFISILLCSLAAYIILILPSILLDNLFAGILSFLGVTTLYLFIGFLILTVFITGMSLFTQGFSFHKSINTDIRNFTFSLPLSTEKLIRNKIIAGSIYLVYTRTLMLLSITILIGFYVNSIPDRSMDMLIDYSDTYSTVFPTLLRIVNQIIKKDFSPDLIIMIIDYILAIISSSALLFFSVAVGGRMESFSRTTAFIIYILTSIFTELLFLFVNMSIDIYIPMDDLLYQMLFVSILKNIVLAFIYYKASCYIIKIRLRQ